MTKLTICVCGGGNGSHVTAGYLGAKTEEYTVNVLTRQPKKWIDGMKKNGGMTVHCRKNGETKMTKIVGPVNKVSSDAKDVAPSADIFILGGPSHANPHLLKAIAPYVKKGAIISTLYGQGGFDWAVENALGAEKFKTVQIFAFQNIPWICTKIAYGSEVRMIGPKKYLLLASIPRKNAPELAKLAEKLFDIPTKTLPNFLCLTLTPSNQIIHPGRYYGIFKDWDGKKGYDRSTIPLLYEGMDDFSADQMQHLSNELQSIKNGLVKKYPKLDLTSVKDLGKRIIEQYGNDVKDTSSLKNIFATNLGYASCKTPVVPHPSLKDKVIPVVNSRFFVEDLPFGLCILRNLADMLDIKVPYVTKFIFWYQQFMNKEYLTKDDKLNEKLIQETGTPKRYGIKSLDELVKNYI